MRHCGVLVVTDDRSTRMKYQGAFNQQGHGVYSSHVTVLLFKLLCLWSSFLPSYYVALEAPSPTYHWCTTNYKYFLPAAATLCLNTGLVTSVLAL